jgi:hypothetical protein
MIAVMEYLPMSLATKKMNERYRKRRVEEQKNSGAIPAALASTTAAVVGKAEDEVVDLFNREREYLSTLS